MEPEYEEIEPIFDDKVLVDYDDFVALIEDREIVKTKLNYILRAMRADLPVSTILTIFDDQDDFDGTDFIVHNFYDFPDENNMEKKDEK